MPAVLLGEASRWDATDAAVRAHLVVVATPVGDGLAGLLQRLEPVLVEALVAELAVEALDVAVLHGFARLDEQMPDVMLDRPGDESPAGELRPVVGSYRGRVAPEDRGAVEQSSDVLARDAV